MSDELSREARYSIVGRSRDWIKKFDVRDYESNPPLIEKLFEEKQLALVATLDLEQRVTDLSAEVHRLQLENQGLSMQLDAIRGQSLTGFALSVMAAIAVGIGVNIVTDKPYGWVGWLMIAFSAALESVIFFISVRNRRGPGDE